jgi:hypothetical protein
MEVPTKSNNVGVFVVDDELQKEHGPENPLIPNYKEKMADIIALLDKQNEMRNAAENKGKRIHEVEKQVKQVVNQKELDAVFKQYLANEYQDDQIGDLEGDEGVNPLNFIGEDGELLEGEGDEEDAYDYGELTDGDMETGSQVPMSNMDMLEAKQLQDKEAINEAVDEFIQDKKNWFRKLHSVHGQDLQQTAIEKGS